MPEYSPLPRPENPQIVDQTTGRAREDWLQFFEQVKRRLNALIGLTPLSSLVAAGAVPVAEQFSVLAANFSGSNVDTAQPVFDTGQDTLTVADGTAYGFEAEYLITRAAGSTSHTTLILFGGTATFTNFDARVLSANPNGTAIGAASSVWMTSAGATIVTASNNSTTENLRISIRGTMRVNAGGTVIPQFQYSAAPGGAPTIQRGSFFRCWPIGANTVTQAGSWS